MQLEALAAEKGVTPAQLSMGWLLQKGKVSFQWKNPDFLFKNPDFLFKNVVFIGSWRGSAAHSGDENPEPRA